MQNVEFTMKNIHASKIQTTLNHHKNINIIIEIWTEWFLELGKEFQTFHSQDPDFS